MRIETRVVRPGEGLPPEPPRPPRLPPRQLTPEEQQAMWQLDHEREPNPDPPSERVRAFLAGLSELTREHGIVIGACGCCGSPDLELLDGSGRDIDGHRYERVDWHGDGYDVEVKEAGADE